MFSQLFIAAALAVSAQSAIAAGCLKSYTVQEGDYCDKISQAQNISTYQLAVLNSNAINSACSNLHSGETLCLANNADENCSTTYTVLTGDTCSGIASKNAVNTTILYANNPQINEECSNIYPGEVLCTSKDVRVAPIPAHGVTVAGTSTTITVTPTHTPAPAVATPVPVVISTPKAAATGARSSSAHAATPSSAVSNDGDDGDDDNLPFCDEL